MWVLISRWLFTQPSQILFLTFNNSLYRNDCVVKASSDTYINLIKSNTKSALAYSLELNVHSNLLRLIRDAGKWGREGGERGGTYALPPTPYTVTTRMTLR